MTNINLVSRQELFEAHLRVLQQNMEARDAAYDEYQKRVEWVAESLLDAQADLGSGAFTSLAAELGTTAGALQLIVNRHKARNSTQGDD